MFHYSKPLGRRYMCEKVSSIKHVQRACVCNFGVASDFKLNKVG